jgi:hypothetical protein
MTVGNIRFGGGSDSGRWTRDDHEEIEVHGAQLSSFYGACCGAQFRHRRSDSCRNEVQRMSRAGWPLISIELEGEDEFSTICIRLHRLRNQKAGVAEI